LDVAILNPFDSVVDSFRIEQLYVERYVVILPPGHALKESNAVSLADLAGLPYVDRLACEMREMVMRVCGERGVPLYARFRSEREDWVQAMVAASLGFAFMPGHSVTHPGSIQRPLADPPRQRSTALMTKRGRPRPPAVEFHARRARAPLAGLRAPGAGQETSARG